MTLSKHRAIATIAVKDLARARTFYRDQLGLAITDTEGDEAITFATGDGSLLVYRSAFAGTNRATAATFVVGDDLAPLVQSLRAQGVAFEHYDDMPGTTRDGDIHRAGDMAMAWFRDPDGNIIGLVSA